MRCGGGEGEREGGREGRRVSQTAQRPRLLHTPTRAKHALCEYENADETKKSSPPQCQRKTESDEGSGGGIGVGVGFVGGGGGGGGGRGGGGGGGGGACQKRRN